MSATPSDPASGVPTSPPILPETAAALGLTLTPDEAWEPLPDSAWNAAAARHLLRRAGWTAKPAEVARVTKEGLAASLDRLFPVSVPAFAVPTALVGLDEKMAGLQTQIATASAAPDQPQQKLRAELNASLQQAEQELTCHWLQFAGRPENAVTEKWVLFLGDVYVVSQEKVRNPELIYAHQDLLRREGLGNAVALAKAVSRSPAMIMYLDLQQSQRNAPNENFARELFELFLLGEGNYTEQDIKESARAFTGYRQVRGVYRFAPGQHDPGTKTIFGHSGSFVGDDVIDLAFGLPAAGTYLAHKLARFYLTDDPLPKPYLAALGDWWRNAAGYDLRRMAQRFFGSRIFFDPAFRGNYIKSPVQFLLGMTEDLNLDVAPIPRRTIAPLRLMNQIPFRPPNVRGWVGGRNWINSSTLAARRQAVETLFAPFNEAALNADERVALDEARTQGDSHFSFTPDRLAGLAQLPPEQLTDQLIETLLPMKVDSAYRSAIAEFLATDTPENSAVPRGAGQGARRGAGSAGAELRRLSRLRNATITILQSPEYQLC